jgi:DNA helicase-2/ATP-dependent DNA helicase PcrA
MTTSPATALEPAIKISPADLCAKLGLHVPTPDQAAVIGAPASPCVVVAGAGSGKTETMATRVVWLVANGLTVPGSVLGLTFTRKAAAELAHRLRRRLGQLRSRGLLAPADPEDSLAGEPTVSTYHAYASRIVAEHGLRIGVEPSTRLLGEAGTWQLAHRVVYNWDGPMDAVEHAPSTVVGAVVALASELADHLVEPEDIERLCDELTAKVEALPRKPGGPAGSPYAEVSRMLTRQQARRQLMPLVRAYQQLKRESEVMDFGDQLRLAARIAELAPEVSAAERDRFGIVLLDEYQDTGHSQLVMLRALFGAGHAVTAVGDPCQSIYSWRGASAGTLARFREEFKSDDGRPAVRYSLRTSFRNSSRILAVANRLSGELRAGGLDVDELSPGPGAGAGRVICAVYPTVADETLALVEQVRALWDADQHRRDSGEPGRSIAVLCRKRSRLSPLAEALKHAGLPVEVVGLGGLLATPEVRDLIATLRVVTDPAAGDALIRLLTGARWRIGPRDLDALGRWARVLVRETSEFTASAPDRSGPASAGPARTGSAGAGSVEADPVEADMDEAGPVELAAAEFSPPEETEIRSIVDALDRLPGPEWFSPAGYRRLRTLASELSSLRRRVGQPLPDLVADVERTLRLDVEVAARAGRDPGLARSNLDRFLDVCSDFVDAAPQAGIAAFLDYLAAAEDRERGLAAGEAEVDPERVQLLTVHGAKGLEWDAVFVPGMVDGFFPSAAGTPSAAWTTDISALPYPLRGDHGYLPELRFDDAETQKELEQARLRFREECGERELLEERRLAYVAITRARSLLMCTGYRWDHRTAPAVPADFLLELREECEAGAGEVSEWADPPEEGDENPVLVAGAEHPWPYDPLAVRRAEVVNGADRVIQAGRTMFPPIPNSSAPQGTIPEQSFPERPSAERPSAEKPSAEKPSAAAGLTPAGLTPAGLTPAVPTPEDLSLDEFTWEELSAQDQALRVAWERDVELLLTERARRARPAEVVVELPAELSVSRLVALRRDPEELARRIRRPVPYAPAPLARRGTAFHLWLEQRFGAEVLLDVTELPGSADHDAATDGDLESLKAAFERSEWADRTPHAVEVPFQTVVDGTVIRGRMDAVFREQTGGFDVVDWKTGQLPSGTDADAAAIQLAAYRLAWAQLEGVPLDQVRAAFHYVRSGKTVRPADLLDFEGLTAVLQGLPSK